MEFQQKVMKIQKKYLQTLDLRSSAPLTMALLKAVKALT